MKKKLSGFTLLEMLVVLFIISLLLLLSQKESATNKSDAAIVKVVETQIEVFELDYGRKPEEGELVSKGYVSEDQYNKYVQKK